MACPIELTPRQLFPSDMVRLVNVYCTHTHVFCLSRTVRHQRIHPGTPLQMQTRCVESAARASPRVSGEIVLARMVACFAVRFASAVANETRVKIE